LAYWPVSFFLFSIKWDSINITLPWRYFISDVINSGELPFWYPYQFCGFGQFMDPQTWYWPSWILGLFGYTNLSLHLEYIIHLAIASIGFFKLLLYLGSEKKAALIVSLLYSSSGFFIGNFQHLGWIISATWLPIIYYNFLNLISTTKTKYIIYFSIAAYLFISGGYWGIIIPTFYSLGIIIIIYVWKNKTLDIKLLKTLLLTLGLTIILSIIIITSIFDSLELISRGKGLNAKEAIVGSFYLVDLLTFIVPFATFNNWHFWITDVSLSNIYTGGFTIVLLSYWFLKNKFKIQSNKIKIILLLVLIPFMLSLGATIPLWPLLNKTIPLFVFLRFPATMRIFIITGILIVFSLVLSDIVSSHRYPIKLFFWMSIIYISTSLFLILFYFDKNLLLSHNLQELKKNNLIPFTSALQLSIVGFLFFLAYSLKRIKSYTKKISFFFTIILFEIFVSVQLNIFITGVQRKIAPQ
jgi:hypothetical protein